MARVPAEAQPAQQEERQARRRAADDQRPRRRRRVAARCLVVHGGARQRGAAARGDRGGGGGGGSNGGGVGGGVGCAFEVERLRVEAAVHWLVAGAVLLRGERAVVERRGRHAATHAQHACRQVGHRGGGVIVERGAGGGVAGQGRHHAARAARDAPIIGVGGGERVEVGRAGVHASLDGDAAAAQCVGARVVVEYGAVGRPRHRAHAAHADGARAVEGRVGVNTGVALLRHRAAPDGLDAAAIVVRGVRVVVERRGRTAAAQLEAAARRLHRRHVIVDRAAHHAPQERRVGGGGARRGHMHLCGGIEGVVIGKHAAGGEGWRCARRQAAGPGPKGSKG